MRALRQKRVPYRGPRFSRYAPGQWKLPSTDNLGFALIEEGAFLMGSDPDRHRGALIDERLQTTVQLPAFFMSRYEVTVDQYKACVDDAGSCKNANPAALKGPGDRPVRFIPGTKRWILQMAGQQVAVVERHTGPARGRAQRRTRWTGVEGQAAERS